MINAGEIKLLYIRKTLARQGNETIQAYEFHFSLRDEGDYSAIVPVAGYTKEMGKAAIDAVAEPLLATMDLYK